MGTAESKQAHRQIHESSAAGVRFPNILTLCYDSSAWSKLRLFVRGGDEDPSAPPLYAFNLPGGWHGDLTMHKGPSLDDAPLAAARDAGKLGLGSVITLPPLGPGQEPLEETMAVRRNGLCEAYTFAAMVGTGTDRRFERFEWVGTKGKEVKSLDEWLRGWKLRRVKRDGNDDDGHGGEEEVLAVWADATMSLKKAAKFQFINSGATGQLGETWSLMAVFTFVRVWQRGMQQAVVVNY